MSNCYKCANEMSHAWHDDGTFNTYYVIRNQIDWHKENREKAEARRDATKV